MLHITNGDAVVARMRDGGLPGTCLPWRDVLHEGPVPQTRTLAELSRIRARHLAQIGWGEELRLQDQFRARDAQLARAHEFGEIVLWFEHDLYDQLQLLQLLDWFVHNPVAVPVTLILVGEYPGIARFVGLGQLSPRQLVGLLDSRVPVSAAQLDDAQRTWHAFRQPTPEALAELARAGSEPLGYLGDALLRLLEELPCVRDGLTRTERAALAAIGDGVASPPAVFAAVQAIEPRPFMGDWSFWRVLARLASQPAPLIVPAGGGAFRHPPGLEDEAAFAGQQLLLTPAGRDVLENRADAIRLKPLESWLGGTHLHAGHVWRWDGESQRLSAPTQ